MARSEHFQRYVEACTYPGVVDPVAVEAHLQRYLDALGVTRTIVRIDDGWTLEEHPSLSRYVDQVLDDFARLTGQSRATDAAAAMAAWAARAARAARDAWDAMAATDAWDAMAAWAARDAASRRFAVWCVQRGGWWLWCELSWLATTFLGAVQLKHPTVIAWSAPVFEAFVSGAWILHWTEDTLYWVAKPRVYVESANGRRRLHHETSAAVESDIERLYFWHGVLVPAFVVVKPEWITLDHIRQEQNVEVRRVMIERFGFHRFIHESGALPIHADACGTLYTIAMPDGEAITVVSVVNSTAEPNGSFKMYMLPVEAACRPLLPHGVFGDPQDLTARNAVASTFGLRGDQYQPAVET